MTKRTVTFFMLLAVCMLVHAQTYRIEGTVIDKTSRKPLEFVNVLVVGLGIGSSTDAEGHFAVEQVPPGIYRLQASMLGYKTVFTSEYRVNHRTPHIQIEMEEEALEPMLSRNIIKLQITDNHILSKAQSKSKSF